MKRLLDVAVSALLLIPALPVLGLMAIIILLETPGNPFFGQTRLGRHERPFTIWKLRSMQTGTPQLGTHEVEPAALTRIGRFARRTKLDELPQLYNILRGDMSLVGPRPCLPNQTRVIVERRKADVFAARPGVTGLAQVNGIDMSRPEELAQFDRAYIDRQSLALDVRICLLTAGLIGR